MCVAKQSFVTETYYKKRIKIWHLHHGVDKMDTRDYKTLLKSFKHDVGFVDHQIKSFDEFIDVRVQKIIDGQGQDTEARSQGSRRRHKADNAD